MSPKRKAVRPAAKPPGRVKKTFVLSADLARRLAAFAAWNGRDESAVVAEALEAVVAGVYVSQRGSNQSEGSDGPSIAATA